MTSITKITQLDLFIKNKNEVEKVVLEAKKKNFSRRINFLFGELTKIQAEIEALGLDKEEEKTP